MNRRPVVAISTPALPDAVATSGLTAPPEGGDTREAAEAKCDAVTNGVVDGPTVGSVLGVGATLGCPDDLPDALPGVAGDATDLALPDALADRPDDRLSQLYPTGAAALASLTRQGLGGAGNVTDRGTGQLARRPRRILAEIDRVLAECDATHLPPLGTWPAGTAAAVLELADAAGIQLATWQRQFLEDVYTPGMTWPPRRPTRRGGSQR